MSALWVRSVFCVSRMTTIGSPEISRRSARLPGAMTTRSAISGVSHQEASCPRSLHHSYSPLCLAGLPGTHAPNDPYVSGSFDPVFGRGALSRGKLCVCFHVPSAWRVLTPWASSQLIGTRTPAPRRSGRHDGGLRKQTGYGRATIEETCRLLAERGIVNVRPERCSGFVLDEGQPRSPAASDPSDAPRRDNHCHAIAVRGAHEAAATRTGRDSRDLGACLNTMRRFGHGL